jgi:hypothetical protein
MDVWICDSGSDRVYRYPSGRTSVQPLMADSFALSAANSNAQGIADPPPVSGDVVESFSSAPQHSTYDPAPAAARRINLFPTAAENLANAGSTAAKAERHTSLRTLGNTNARNTKSTAPAAASVPAVLNTVLAPENAAQSIDDLFSSLELQQSLLN